MNRMDNPEFQFDLETSLALDQRREEEQKSRDAFADFQIAMAPTEGELEIRRSTARYAAEVAGVDEVSVLRVRDEEAKKLDIARSYIETRADSPEYLFDVAMDVSPSQTSPDFWWASTHWNHSNDFNSSFQSSGLVLSGGPNGSPHADWLGNTDLIYASLWAKAAFEISADRIPHSPTGRYLSEPYVDIYGGLLAHTSGGDWPGGDSWSKCWLHLDQKVLQYGFGEPYVLGWAHTAEQIINEENASRTFYRSLNGFTPVPSFTFRNLLPRLSLWAEVEVRLDIQIEGAGSFLWCDPIIRLVTRQWPLRVIS